MLRYVARLLRVQVQTTLLPHKNKTVGEELAKDKNNLTSNGNLKTRLLHKDEEESTPFLDNPINNKSGMQSENWKTRKIHSSLSADVRMNGSCTAGDFKDVEASTDTYATVTNALEWNPTHAIPLYCGSNSTFPRNISETNASFSPSNFRTQQPTPNPPTTSQFMPTHAYRKPALKKCTSQSLLRTNSRCSTPLSVIQQENDIIAKKRQSLLLMNASTRTADYSDDTEASGSTQISSEHSRCSSSSKNAPSHFSGHSSSFHFGRNKTSLRISSYDGNVKLRYPIASIQLKFVFLRCLYHHLPVNTVVHESTAV